MCTHLQVTCRHEDKEICTLLLPMEAAQHGVPGLCGQKGG